MYHGYLILLAADCHLWPNLVTLPNQLVTYHTGVACGFAPVLPQIRKDAVLSLSTYLL